MGCTNSTQASNGKRRPIQKHRRFRSQDQWSVQQEASTTDFSQYQYGVQAEHYNQVSYSVDQVGYDEPNNCYTQDIHTGTVSDAAFYVDPSSESNYSQPIPQWNNLYNSEGCNTQYLSDEYNEGVTYVTPLSNNNWSAYSNQQYHSQPLPRPNSVSGSEIPYARPVTRRHSFNEDFRRPQYDAFPQYDASQLRCNSLNNVYYTTQFGQHPNYASNDVIYTTSSLSSASNAPISYQSFSSVSNSENEIRGRVGQGGLKRNSWDDDDCGGNEDNGSDYGYGNETTNDHHQNRYPSFAGPRVKRKQWSSCTNAYDRLIGNSSESTGSEISLEQTKHCHYKSDTSSNVGTETSSQSDEPFDVLDILSFPSMWSSCSVEKTGYVDISLNSPEGKSVERFFERTSHTKDFRLQISSIVRVESPFLHTMYLLKKEEMHSRNGHVDELFLYHGTKKDCVSRICEDNLNWRMFGEKHKFGQGVSFSPLANYSSHYCDGNAVVKVMLLFKVLVSNAVNGSDDMTIPPKERDITFDTSIKDDTRVIVKYCDNEFYPLYKIMFKKCIS